MFDKCFGDFFCFDFDINALLHFAVCRSGLPLRALFLLAQRRLARLEAVRNVFAGTIDNKVILVYTFCRVVLFNVLDVRLADRLKISEILRTTLFFVNSLF